MMFLWSVLGFVVAMGLLVAIHEGGHYLVGRLFNVKVLQFSLGFGKAFWTKQMGETEFRLAWIPLGGFVKFVDEREGEVSEADLPRAFNRQSVYKRFAIVLAGPAINLLFAWLAFSLMYFNGVSGVKPLFSPIESTGTLSTQLVQMVDEKRLSKMQLQQPWEIVSLAGQSVHSWQDIYQIIVDELVHGTQMVRLQAKNLNDNNVFSLELSLADLDINQPKQNWVRLLGFHYFSPKFPAKVDRVLPNTAASRAGLHSGDLITSLNGQKIENWQNLVKMVQQNPNKTVTITWLRGHQTMTQQVVLDAKKQGHKTLGMIGLSVFIDPEKMKAFQTQVSYSFVDALEKGWTHSVNLVDMTLVMIKRMFTGDISPTNLSGPVSIAQYSGQALQSGFTSFISLLGLLSLSLGVLNLLPIPVLDGGHLFLYLIEMLKGEPVSEGVEAFSQKVGLVLILGLTFFAIFNDLVRVTNG